MNCINLRCHSYPASDVADVAVRWLYNKGIIFIFELMNVNYETKCCKTETLKMDKAYKTELYE